MTDWPPSTKPFRSSPPEGSVAIVLPIRDDLRFFKLCYHSLLAFTDYRHMLTVVDNMSGWETRQYLESIRRNHNINVLQFQKPHNLGAEWNLGIRYMFSFATVHYAAVMTPTIVFEPFWLSGTIRSIQDAKGVGGAVACTPGEASDLLVVTRKAYEELGGFREDVADPAADFSQRIQSGNHGGITVGPFIHKFKLNGFDPKREEPATAPAKETTEAK